jgi:hypothetical protein
LGRKLPSKRSSTFFMGIRGVRFCDFCQGEHPRTSEFWQITKQGWFKYCRKKKAEVDKLSYLKHKDKRDAYNRTNRHKYTDHISRYYHENRDKIIADVTANRKRNAERYRLKASARRRVRLRTDINFRLVENCRHRIWCFLKGKGKSKKTRDILGCDMEFLKQHLERSFLDGMTWENYGDWHVDHIIPISSATTEEDMVRLCHYENLQPLWAIDNIRKSNG